LHLDLIGGVAGFIAAGLGIYVMLYALGCFQYLGGKKRPNHFLNRVSQHLRHTRIDEGRVGILVNTPYALLEFLDE